jgi:CRP-like cAMP-binding protein
MSNIALSKYIEKLIRRSELPHRDREAILSLPCREQDYLAGDTIVGIGAPTTHCCFVESGFVSRVKRVPPDLNQILAFHIPGDGVDLQSLFFTASDHKIYANAPTRVVWVPHEAILELAAERPVVANALWLDTLADASIFREWTVNVGQRRAVDRIAHLFLELYTRLLAIGAVHDESFELPLTQTAMADAVGLSLVHLNKSLQLLKKDGCVQTKGRIVILTDKAKMIRHSGFDSDYLYLDGKRVKAFSEDCEVVSAVA